ncbi:MAG: hypothetical protein HFJ53_06075 [Clostridia bacterium]|jgi:hypothetical protein|nr:hypothetical protein [Clostridia bacterium]
MDSKKWTFITLTITFMLLLMIASVMIYIDPLFQYHKPLANIAYQINSQDYQNPGMVKNFDYDSLMVGSSMTENFSMSWFKENMGLNVLKVSYSGARPKNIKKITEMAQERNKNLKTIFLGYDLFTQATAPDKLNHELPEYLYDDNIFNDIEYWFNKDLIKRTYKVLKNTKEGNTSTTLDEAYNWNNSYQFSENETIKDYSINRRNAKIAYDSGLKNTKSNMEKNIKPIIENNPNTEIYIFYPPYTILYWHKIIEDNKIDLIFDQLEYSMEEFLKYDNVKLFYFQNIEEIITNLYLYRDYSHYNQKINDYMSQCFKEKKHLITKENYKEEIEKMKELILNFDYDIYWGDKTILKRENNSFIYLELLKNSNYITIIEANKTKNILNDENVAKQFKYLGLTYEFNENDKYYTAIINGKEVYEKIDNHPFSTTNIIEGKKIEIQTSKLKDDYSHIEIDEVDYSKQKNDINIVVYDKTQNRVVDSINFDLKTLKIMR